MPRATSDGDEGAGGIPSPVLEQRRHVRDRVAVVPFEETDHFGVVGAVEGREGMVAFERPEQGAGEGSVGRAIIIEPPCGQT